LGEHEDGVHPADRSDLPSAEAVIETAPLGLGVLSPEGRYLTVNRALVELIARPAEELIGADAVSFLYEDDQGRAREALDALRTGHVEKASGDYRYVRGDGVVVCTRLAVAVLRGEAQRVIGVVLQAADITAEREAAAAQAQLASLVDALDEPVLTLDGNACVRTWNAAAQALLGWSAEEIIGQPVTRLVSSDHQDEQQTNLGLLREGRTVRVDTVRLHKDGSGVEVRLTATPVLAADGTMTAAIGVMHDIREQVQAARQLKHLAGHDLVTGLPNRREITQRLTAATARSRSTGELLGLLFIDLDGFKQVNDRYGHAVGDEYLHIVADRLRRTIRPTDVLGRWGGDEYLAVIEHASSVDDVVAVARRLLEALHRPLHVKNLLLPASASVGVSYTRGTSNGDQLVTAADSAMYLAKKAGGDQVALVDEAAS
jgi:diguanylate cyclase (GGDEF)-like protein/PAS domain S-box-containing protein